MAINRKKGAGIVLQYTNAGAAIASGDLVALGDNGLVGLALEDIANGAAGSVMVPGAFSCSFPVKGHNGTANAAAAIYDAVYFTAGEAFLDLDTNALKTGYTLAAVTSGATTTVEVLMVG